MRFALIDDNGDIITTNRGDELSMTEEEILTRLQQKTCELLGVKGKKAERIKIAVAGAWRWTSKALMQRRIYKF